MTASSGSLRARGIQGWIRRHPSCPQEAHRNDQRRWSQMWMLPREPPPKVICAATWTEWWGSRRRERGLRWWLGVGSDVLPLTRFTGPRVDKTQLGSWKKNQGAGGIADMFILSQQQQQQVFKDYWYTKTDKSGPWPSRCKGPMLQRSAILLFTEHKVWGCERVGQESLTGSMLSVSFSTSGLSKVMTLAPWCLLSHFLHLLALSFSPPSLPYLRVSASLSFSPGPSFPFISLHYLLGNWIYSLHVKYHPWSMDTPPIARPAHISLMNFRLEFRLPVSLHSGVHMLLEIHTSKRELILFSFQPIPPPTNLTKCYNLHA